METEETAENALSMEIETHQFVLIPLVPVIGVIYDVIEVSDGPGHKKPNKKVKNKQTPLKCPECPKTYLKSLNFKFHLRTHNGKPPVKNFQCNICAKMFQTNCLLKRHMNCHLGETRERKYTCMDCGKAYTQLSHLRDHEFKHHGKGEKRFHCSECNRYFYRKGDFDRHYRIHIGVKNFACDQCDKRFTQKCNLDQHQKTHSGDKKFECILCLKKFITNSKLTKHIKSHENKLVKELLKRTITRDCDCMNRVDDYVSSSSLDE